MSKQKLTLDFESALKELNQLVEQMEKGNLSLESSLAYFEQGVHLIKHCQELLKNAEQRIHLYDKTENSLQPFDQNERLDKA